MGVLLVIFVKELSPPLALCQSINAGLPAANAHVNGMQCTTLLNTGWSLSKISVSCCGTWNRQHMTVETIDGISHACCRVGVISILTEGGNCAKMDGLVVCDKPLGMIYWLGVMQYMNWVVLWSGLLERSAAWEEMGIMCSHHDWGIGLLCCFWLWEKSLDSEVEVSRKQSARSTAQYRCGIYCVW